MLILCLKLMHSLLSWKARSQRTEEAVALEMSKQRWLQAHMLQTELCVASAWSGVLLNKGLSAVHAGL